MRKRKLANYSLSKRVPESAESVSIAAITLYNSIEELSRDYLMGAIIPVDSKIPVGNISTRPAMLSYAIRLAVQYGTSEGPLRISFNSRDENLVIKFVFASDITLDEAAEIAVALRKAGFLVAGALCEINAEAPLYRTQKIQVYNDPRKPLLDILYDVFFL